MATGLLVDQDEYVAKCLFEHYKWPRFNYDKALGLINEEHKLVGAVLFSNYNGHNVEISYFGAKTMRLGIIRCLARYLLVQFDPSRVTAITSKKNRVFIRGLQKIGFKLEGVQRRHYGQADINRNVGVRFVMFREQLEKLGHVGKYAVEVG